MHSFLETPRCFGLRVVLAAGYRAHGCCRAQGSGKDLIQPVLDNQLKTISPLVLPEGVRSEP